MKRTHPVPSPVKEPIKPCNYFQYLPTEILCQILSTCHHTVFHLNTVSKSFFHATEATRNWFDIADDNYRYTLGKIHELSNDPRYPPNGGTVCQMVIELFDKIKGSALYKSLCKEARYHRFLNHVGLLMNSKLATVSTIKKMQYGYPPSNTLTSTIKYITEAIDNPLTLRNFHRRDFYLNFREQGHCYTLVRCIQKPNTGKTAFVNVLSNQEPDDNDALVDDALTCPDGYTPITDSIIARSSDQILCSTTKYIHTLYPPFMAMKVLARMREDPVRWEDPEYQYFGMTDVEILDSWTQNGIDASYKGTLMHLNIELYYTGRPYDGTTPEFALFLDYEKDHVTGKLIPYRSEWTIYCEYLAMCGSVDMLYERVGDQLHVNDTPLYGVSPLGKKKHLEMADWKRCKNVVDYNTWADDNSGIVPCTFHCPNANFFHYVIQLCIYKYILERDYDVIIDRMYLVILHPNQKKYIKREIKWDAHTQIFIAGVIQHRLNTIKPDEPHFDMRTANEHKFVEVIM